jgi:hypothetical protein
MHPLACITTVNFFWQAIIRKGCPGNRAAFLLTTDWWDVKRIEQIILGALVFYH